MYPTRFILALLLTITGLNTSAAESDEKILAVATFAGGCFWCMEPPYDKTKGVMSTISGYMGGHLENPTYKKISSGNTGHYEVLQVTYDPEQVSYEELLDVFWKNIDPTDGRGQFCDKGPQYRSGIFVHNEQQRKLAGESLDRLNKNKPFSGSVKTEILNATKFYPAEEYHQDYYTKNPLRYRYYRHGCGRDKRLKQLWGKS